MRLLPQIPHLHSPAEPMHGFFQELALMSAQDLFSENGVSRGLEPPFDGLAFPFYSMGKINSLHLFGVDELILFSFYWLNRSRYRKVLDLGANIGLHSIIFAKCGYDVTCYEPDPETFAILKRNLELNKASTVRPENAAISTTKGEMDFLRIKDNRTGSHLAGAKANPYGEMDRFKVRVDEFAPLLRSVDFCKIDIEGHEKVVLLSTTKEDWARADVMAEIGTAENAHAVYAHMSKIGVKMFAQKSGWRAVESQADMPSSYKDGSLFLSLKANMPWGS